MRLAIFNGTQKTGRNNTGILADKFAQGFFGNHENQYAIYQLNQFQNPEDAVQIYKDSEYVMIAFPMHNYSMTAIVKEFVEKLPPSEEKKIGFLVQFGFPEAIHARPLERYLEKLAGLLKCRYLGTIIKGGCNDLTNSPERHKKIFSGIYEIGKNFGKNGFLDKNALRRFSKPEKLPAFIPKFVFKFMAFLINKFYIDPMMKKKGYLRAV